MKERHRLVQRIPWWAVVSAGAGPALLGGGLALGQWRQPSSYDPVRDTISALAARGAADRWIMTSALAGLGACHVVTAVGLQPGRRTGRLLLAAGGVATVAVAVFPQPRQGNSVEHTVAAAVAFGALSLWPLLAPPVPPVPPLLTGVASTTAAAFLVGAGVWFVAEVHGGQRGLAERTAAGLEALWPLAVVVTTGWRDRSSRL
jgi:hypothetical protein